MKRAPVHLPLIKQLEKDLDVTMEPCPFDEIESAGENGFSVDEKGVVNGLRLFGVQVAPAIGTLAKFPDLKKLTIVQGEISNCTFLQNYPLLTHLDLTGNAIADISCLEKLKNLANVYLGRNRLTDITALGGLNRLAGLDLRYNIITGISALNGLGRLAYLDLTHNKITDISPLKDLKQLTYLNAGDNQIQDISWLRELDRLTYAALPRNKIDDISCLRELSRLTYLDLAGNSIEDISCLQRLSELTYLDLSDNPVTDISELKDLRQLKELYLRSNKISDISCIRDLCRLQKLNLSRTKITDISFLQEMTDLTVLNLLSNQLTDICVLQSLTKLEELSLGGNQLTDISVLRSLTQLKKLTLHSNQVADISSLQSLMQLQKLMLVNNQLTDISPLRSLTKLKLLALHNNQLTDISALQSLMQLKKLYIGYNQLTDISTLQSLTKLEVLSVSNNQLTDISTLQSLTQLNTLSLSDNRLTDISALQSLTKLKTLDLANNNITRLPSFIGQWHMEIKWREYYIGDGLNLYGNPLETPPVEIVKQGMAAVRNYFAELEKAEALLLQAKLLFVGSGEVGKTTLMRTLTEPGFQLKKQDVGKEETTHGIRIKPWTLTCPLEADSEPSRELTLHTWDFGGQDIYHSTHQFFLTKRSLYILVWEARKEEESRAFDYWLNVVRLLSENSPVIVVMNKADVRGKPIDEAAYADKFKNVAAFLQVSCLDRRGMDELNRTIRRVLGRMPHLKDKLPRIWQDIRKELEAEKKNYIDAARYYIICDSFGLDRDRADYLSDYLHDLGAILRFRTDPFLKNTLVLNPEWATEAVYNLVDTPKILENKGRFVFEDLETTWDPVKYPVNKHRELIRLMEKFELCFNFTGTTTYIIPELVPGQRPVIGASYLQAEGTLRFRYSYDFMPKGIVSRFIARNYYLIRGERFWQNGVELVFEDSTALIMGDPPGRKLEIWVRGPQKSELLAIIRNDLDHIHTTLNMKKELNYLNHYKEEVPCNCSSCSVSKEPHLFPFDVLKKMSKKEKELTCFKSYEDVSPDVLLRGYALPGREESLLQSLLVSVSLLQGKALSIHPDENSRTGFVAQLLKARGFVVQEQVLWGRSESGENPGELDLKVDDEKGKSIAVGEAFNLSYLNRANISNHLKKIFGYDPHGLPENFILVYVDSKDFAGLWKKYCKYLAEVDYPFDLVGEVELLETEMAEINCARTAHSRRDKKTYLYHIFVNMAPSPVKSKIIAGRLFS